jgi:hypothetical protein
LLNIVYTALTLFGGITNDEASKPLKAALENGATFWNAVWTFKKFVHTTSAEVLIGNILRTSRRKFSPSPQALLYQVPGRCIARGAQRQRRL